MKITIATVLYGGLEVLEHTLPTWIIAADGFDVDFLFIDNTSTSEVESFVASLSADTSRVRLERRPTNPGFAASANEALRMAHGWVFLLNPDVFLSADALRALVEHARDWSPSDAPNVTAVSLETNGRVLAGIELDAFGYFSDRPVKSRRTCLGPSGGAALLSPKALEKVGVFDEDLFAWGEDVSLALKMYASGTRVDVLDLALAHVGGHTVATIDGLRRKAFLLARNRVVILRRYYSPSLKAVLCVPQFVMMTLNGFRKIPQRTAGPHFKGLLAGLRYKQVRAAETDRLTLRGFLEYRTATPS